MADGPNFLINTELSGLNNENLDAKSIGLSHDIDGNKNERSTGTKEFLVYSRRKQIQRNETDTSQYCQDFVPQTIQKSIEATDDTHTNPIHLNLPSSKSSQSESSMSNLDKPIAHRKVYVDDIILTGDDIAEMERLNQCLASEFEIKDLGSLKFFLGMEIDQSRKGIAVSQRKYVLDLLKETGMRGCRLVETPIDSNQKLGDNKGDPVNTSRYQKLVGKDDLEVEAGRVRRNEAVEDAASRRELDGRRSSLAVLDLEQARNVLDANRGRVSPGEECKEAEDGDDEGDDGGGRGSGGKGGGGRHGRRWPSLGETLGE
ncbi:hypothetical protein RJ639_034616 [Escallonia herrerae]|uniref:Reverse transcriptase Ty1/copia-type domain-containing protein n=1 Tax=Escallonia herrerae TaxID=1293975 RepID=A0AA88X504_9ASTE|nr:hypothetical protein RJ639_034616 [Escallonia herrerae]